MTSALRALRLDRLGIHNNHRPSSFGSICSTIYNGDFSHTYTPSFDGVRWFARYRHGKQADQTQEDATHHGVPECATDAIFPESYDEQPHREFIVDLQYRWVLNLHP